MPAIEKTRRLLRRLAQARWEELRFRCAQDLRNRWDGLCYRLGELPEADGLGLFSETPPQALGRFFFSTNDLPLLAEVLGTRLPEAMREVLTRAERALAHRFNLLGFSDRELGPEIDWHFDPVHNKRAPRKLWYRIPYLDFDAVGDVKIIWELNRHQHWVTLGKAYQLTGAEKFAREFVLQFCDWQEQNPYPIGVNWASSLEVAFRSLSWLWARELFTGAPALSENFRRDLVTSLGRNARFIERNLSRYFSPNTHLLGEAAALFFIGTLCPELRRAGRWQAQGWKIIQEEARRQVRPDGGYFEQSTYYHVYALDFFMHARILAARNQISIPAEFDRTLLAMLEYLAALGAAGAPPRFGDDDGGRVFDPHRNRAEHLLDPLSTGAILFRRGDFKAVAGTLREETLWLLGPAAAAEFDRLPKASLPASSRAFPETGTCLLASDGLLLALDAGPLGAVRGGHGHADALSLCIAADGCEWLGDPGTFTYTGSREWRDRFRGTGAHNTLGVDGLDQAEPLEPFAWGRFTETRVERWLTGETFDLLVASHDGYMRLPSSVKHRRLVFFVKGHFWLVVDAAEGTGHHLLEISWHAATPQLDLDGAKRGIVTGASGSFALIPVEDPGWSIELCEGSWSPNYGAREARPTLRFSSRVNLPTEFATLLVPQVANRAQLGRLDRLSSDRPDVRGYEYTTDSARHLWILAETAAPWQLGEFSSDARIAYCSRDAAGNIEHVVLCDGTLFAIGGEKILEADRRCSRLEFRCSEGTEELFCSESVGPRWRRQTATRGMAATAAGRSDIANWT